MKNKQAIVIGAGIAGLATARALSLKGFSVKVFDRTQLAVGASIRNFGMIWPIGQPGGKLYDRSIRSRNIWKETCEAAGIWYETSGSLHLAYHADEMQVLTELNDLKLRYQQEMSAYVDWGIHVMVSQNGRGELTVGDSHEYGLTFDPFDKQFINTMILDYLQRFVRSKDWTLVESWNGTYPKLTNGETDIFISPEEGVYILNGLGGAGMTMSFGLAEEMVNTI